jgi:hypothetical protein
VPVIYVCWPRVQNSYTHKLAHVCCIAFAIRILCAECMSRAHSSTMPLMLLLAATVLGFAFQIEVHLHPVALHVSAEHLQLNIAHAPVHNNCTRMQPVPGVTPRGHELRDEAAKVFEQTIKFGQAVS